MWADAQRNGPQPNIGGALCENSEFHSLYHATVWLTAAARVPCSTAANIGERKTRTQSEFCSRQNSVGARTPKKCTSPGDGQTSCKVLLTSVERRRCSNAAKTRNRLKFAGVPQTPEPISAVSGPKWCQDGNFCRFFASCIFREPCAAHFRHAL